jgi:replication factor C large subunit
MSQPWSSLFRPCTLKEIAGNEKAIRQLQDWLKSWEGGAPKQRAAFLYGPPGVGKTCTVTALAADQGYELMEVNASDRRTKKRLNALVGRSIHQRDTITGKRRMILFDELEGVSEHDGVRAIASIIKEAEVPIVLIATSIGERWEDKFRPLKDISLHIKYTAVPFSQSLARLKVIVGELEIHIDEDVLELLADRSRGDLRSAINDLEAIARGRTRITMAETSVLTDRDRNDYTPDALMKLFSAKTLSDARRVISSAHIPYDDLFLWIYENLPLILNDTSDLAEGIDALSRADIHQVRARRTQDYRLIKYMFDEMTGGVALARRNSEGVGLPYFRSPQLVWRYRRTWHSRRCRKSIAKRIAERCHISTREVVAEVIPLLKVIYDEDPSMAEGISRWLDLEDKEVEWMRN